ncbi:MAG: RNA-binding domain-containing protein [Pseudomonadota bacterium]
MTSIEEFNTWLKGPEGLTLEFKEARSQFSRDKDLPDYCAAIANEGGGKLVLGVNDDGKVVGTKAFSGTHAKLSIELFQKIRIRVDIEELHHPNGRVLIFHIPSRPVGQVVRSSGSYTYPYRVGESLVEMDTATLKNILNETEPDFSAQIVPGLEITDLDEEALQNFRTRWAQKAKRVDFLEFPDEKMLTAVGLLSEKGLNYAALILCGKKGKLESLLPGSETIFEWRQESGKIPHDFRVNWREPFFKIYDAIWETINARNSRFPFQEGLFQREVFAFNEKAIREALLNAVTHRDYSIGGRSIFIKASPKEFVIESPGGFPPGITIDNILYKSCWRNRRIAETFEKAELVERAGQGMKDIFESTIREGKGVPDLGDSDTYSVTLKIPAQVKDKNFILFLEKVAREKQTLLSFEEIFELEKIRELRKIEEVKFKGKFLEMGLIEKVGRTKDARYILSHTYYVSEGKAGIHTRISGLPREKQKEFILRHLAKNKKGYFKDFQDIFPELEPMDISNRLRELRQEGKIKHEGSKRHGYWRLA